ncbi:tyrosine-type recombinase/integrase [Parasphingorhabdus halotolerans]|uniref:Tyrosine-type recombinase/integrase n=1 Tax=Parasphingorhabdus halotolerans TaxID=2725558 RepID=A0A6H2DJC3_9SPHN|nr:site-specific integrase [Parasphingorhabdus halotolerans]QJB68237.1 tyrosine-type recombinase/integrase [Parasphingorhabdus halotolerans]
MTKLTVMKIRNLKEPGRYGDGDGLILNLTAPGKGYWLIRTQINGRRRDIGLGSISLVTLAEARDAVHQVRKDIQNGLDPVAERQKAKRVIPTFKDAAILVHKEHRKGWKNGKHQKQWIRTLERYVFPKIGNRLVNDIEGPVICDVLSPIWLEKPETARRVKQRIGVVLDWSYANGFRTSEAPLRSISRGLPKQPKKDGHFAAMPYAEVPAFISHLRSKENVSRLALEFLILTATRSGEVRGAKMDEIDLGNRLWTIPAQRMKMGKTHAIPLTDSTLDVLQRVQPYFAPVSNLIFPGKNVKRPLSDMTLLKVLRVADLPYTVHGFRSSFRDWAAEQTSYPGEVAEAALAHAVTNKVEAAYRRTNYLEKRRDLMRDWEQFCLGTA